MRADESWANLNDMNIAGFQSLSLMDFPGKSCSIVFTQGCPFRCPYCHNPELIPLKGQTQITEETILHYLMEHRKMLDGVCITGGEPTIHVGLRAFIEKVKDLGLLVKLDTNGISPAFVASCIADGIVDYFAMDLKHTWGKYQEIIRAGGAKTVENCQKTFKLIQESGTGHEFRTTLCPGIHTEADFFEMASYLKEGETYFLQETQFKKTLDKNITRETQIHADDLVLKLQQAFPKLLIEAR